MSPDPHPLLPASPASRIDVIRRWLISTFAGRAFLVGASVKLVAFVLSLILGRSRGLDAFDAIGDVALVAATIALVNVVAFVPARAAARTLPAVALREE